jgi:hypothetical protein
VVFDDIRTACAEVASRARCVAIDESRLRSLAHDLADAAIAPAVLDPAHHYAGSESSTLAFVVTLDAVNFGSGWFPRLAKLPGLSGYFSIATHLKRSFEASGALSAAQLRSLAAADCARIFGQVEVFGRPEVAQLMAHFATALQDLGELLETRFAGCFEGLIEEASGSAEELARLLARMPYYRDVSCYEDLEVPFYKRAQLTAADLSAAFGGAGFGAFRDLHSLTLFADNLVPHVLRREKALVYDADLAARIDAGELLAHGSPEEVEIRAVALHAVERMVAMLGDRTAAERAAESRGSVTAQRLDYLLWNRGQRPDIKAYPRHRARCVYY